MLTLPMACLLTSPKPPLGRSGGQDLQLKLFARLRCCCQLEALLDALLLVGGRVAGGRAGRMRR